MFDKIGVSLLLYETNVYFLPTKVYKSIEKVSTLLCNRNIGITVVQPLVDSICLTALIQKFDLVLYNWNKFKKSSTTTNGNNTKKGDETNIKEYIEYIILRKKVCGN